MNELKELLDHIGNEVNLLHQAKLKREVMKLFEEKQKEVEDWKELFFLLKSDHELIGDFQTHEWEEKARKLGVDV